MAHGSFSRMARAPSFKFVLVGFLVLLISGLLAIVWYTLSDRQNRALQVQEEVAQDWGGEQRILGPYLIVPYSVRVKTGDASKVVEFEDERLAIFLPDHFKAAADINTEVRHRAIYDVTVYRSQVALEGDFPAADLKIVDPEASHVRWQDAFVALGIRDVSGLKNNVVLSSGGRTIPFEPSIGVENPLAAQMPGIHARLNLPPSEAANSSQAISYKIDLALNGSSSIKFAPVGRETAVSIKSNWPHPNFTGFLPLDREINPKGFSASWQIPHLARSVPQAWRERAQQPVLDRFSNTDLGVRLFVPIDFYSLVDRALKYGFMFIASAFGGVFVMELLSARRVHPIQYIFVGLAIVMFYILLLSLAEHLGFVLAYVAASVATGGMISIYVGKALHSLRRGVMMLGIFAILYTLLYLILQLEDYALLAGAIAGFVLLTATMFATLRVNWSGDDPQPYSP